MVRETKNSQSRSAIDLNDGFENLSAESQALLSFFQADLAKFKNEFYQDFEKKIERMMSEKTEEIKDLKEQVDVLRTEVKKLEDAIDWADQYERIDSVILSGPAVGSMVEHEDIQVRVQELLKNKLDIDITPADISITHRLGPTKRGSGGAPGIRNIYIKFVRRDLKVKVMKASRTVNKDRNRRSEVDLFVNESLSPLRRNIFFTLRKMKKDVPNLVKGCSTMDGKIFAFTPPVANGSRDQKHHIGNMTDLHNFCRSFVKKPLENFQQNLS